MRGDEGVRRRRDRRGRDAETEHGGANLRVLLHRNTKHTSLETIQPGLSYRAAVDGYVQAESDGSEGLAVVLGTPAERVEVGKA